MVGQMDPYVVIQIGDQKKQTLVKEEGGKVANFYSSLIFDITGMTNDIKVLVHVWDQDDFTPDDMVGSAELTFE